LARGRSGRLGLWQGEFNNQPEAEELQRGAEKEREELQRSCREELLEENTGHNACSQI
jgi:hypothetical protein